MLQPALARPGAAGVAATGALAGVLADAAELLRVLAAATGQPHQPG